LGISIGFYSQLLGEQVPIFIFNEIVFFKGLGLLLLCWGFFQSLFAPIVFLNGFHIPFKPKFPKPKFPLIFFGKYYNMLWGATREIILVFRKLRSPKTLLLRSIGHYLESSSAHYFGKVECGF